MKQVKNILVITWLLASFFCAKATFGKEYPDTTKISTHKLLKLAKHDQVMGMLNDATFFYQAYLHRRQNDIRNMWTLAELYKKLENYDMAIPLYDKIVQANASKNIVVRGWFEFIGDDKHDSYYQKFPLASYYYGIVLKRTGRYKESSMAFYGFLNSYHEKDSAIYLAMAESEIAGNHLALELQKSLPQTKMTEFDSDLYPRRPFDFYTAPEPWQDSSFIYLGVGTSRVGQMEFPGTFPRKAKLVKGTWRDDGPLYEFPFDPWYVVAGGCFSKDKKRYYFTRCDIRRNAFAPPDSKLGMYYEHFSLYRCKIVNGAWQSPEKLDDNINMPGTINLMPSVGTDDRNHDVLYFVSNRPGGYGGYDIWRSNFAVGLDKFDVPVNLGPQINTAENEVTPFYDQDSSALYFSSDGWPGLGGLDIFKAKKIPGGWGPANNLGSPFNSWHNDLYYTLNHAHTSGMEAQSYYCHLICVEPIFQLPFFDCQRIYTFKFKQPQFGLRTKVVVGQGAAAHVALDAKTDVYIDNNTGHTPEILKSFVQTDKPSPVFPLHPKYHYKIHVSKPGYYPVDTFLNTDTFVHSDTVLYLIHLGEIPKDSPITIRNINFDFNDSGLTHDSKNVLDTTLLRYLNKHPEEKIMIISHSDSVGTDEYNLKLSQARAQSVVNYLVTRGISPKRLVAKGYGSRHPIAPNRNKDGTDNPAGRELNRRTEFRVIGNLRKDK